MSPTPVFDRDGDRFVPSDAARGPWSPNALHGGAICGLLARCLEGAVAEPTLQPMRLTVDLFRAAPKAPLRVETRPLREGRRIQVLEASLLREDGVEVARATGLFLLPTDGEHSEPWKSPAPVGPDGLETTSLMGGPPLTGPPRGLHTVIETRWTPERGDGPRTAWFRLPGPLVAGEEASPFVRAATLGDFANAVASRAMPRRPDQIGPIFINTDTTLYLSRPPVGEWIGMTASYGVQQQGVGLIEVTHFDVQGRYGVALQARLANRPG